MMQVIPSRIAIYGTGKIRKDIEILFYDVEVVAYIATADTSSTFKDCDQDVVVYKSLDEFMASRHKDLFVVVATSDYHGDLYVFKQRGFIYEVNYIHAYDIPMLYNKQILNRQYIVMGTGGAMHNMFKLFPQIMLNVPYFLDNNPSKAGTSICGKTIHPPSEIFQNAASESSGRSAIAPIIVTTETAYDQIAHQLSTFGLSEFIDFFSAKYLMEELLFPPSLFIEILNTPPRYDCSCSFYTDGMVFGKNAMETCCYSNYKFFGAGIQSIKIFPYKSIAEARDGFPSRVYKLMLLNKSFTHCDARYCNLLARASLSENVEVDINECRAKMHSPLSSMLIDVDGFCNLTCPSCREVNVMNLTRKNTAKTFAKMLVAVDYTKVKNLHCSTGGEMLASQANFELITGLDLKQYPDLKFCLKTNGTLLHTDRFQKLLESVHRFDVIVSVDGATQKTFEALRRGAKFDVAMENLRYLGRLKAEGKISSLQITTVVQKDNFREIKDIIAMAKQVDASCLDLLRIRELAMSRIPSESIDVYKPDHPDHAEFARLYNDPAMHGSPQDSMRIVWDPPL